mgnify:CR=1 FL=1
MAGEERTEQPTPRRRREAREKGQVAHSDDLSRAIALLLLYLTCRTAGAYIGGSALEVVRSCCTFLSAEDLEQIMAGTLAGVLKGREG